MRTYFFMAAVLAVVTGHIFRAKRWVSFIRVYEDVSYADILRSMFLGYTTDIFIPFHAGDIVRAGYMGKKLANKTAFSFAAIIIDRLLDVFAVALIYFAFYMAGRHDCLRSFVLYAAGALLISALLVWSAMFDRPLKKLILAFSSVFNEKIQLWLLAFSWSGICTIKNIYGSINKLRLLLNTVCMWFFYILSYKLLAMAADGTGTLQIFNIMFMPSGSEQLIMPAILLFNIITCTALLLCAILYGLLFKTKTHRQPDLIIPYISENSRLDFLKIYFSNIHEREYINEFLELNKDVTIIKNCSAGSNATTLLCIKNDGMIFRKYAFGSEGDKLYAQVKWLTDNAKHLPVAQVLGYEKKNGSFCYDMPYSGTSSDFFSYIHSVTEQQAWDILSNVMTDLEQNYKKTSDADADTIKRYFESKISANLKKITSAPQLRQLLSYGTILINKKEYKNLPYFIDKLSDENFWQDIFKDDIYSDIHGDLTVENIIYSSEREHGYYLIDPNGGNIHASPALDHAKLMQSLHGGYEFLMHTHEVKLSGNEISFLMTRSTAYNRLYGRYRQYLAENFGSKRLKSIYFHEIVHWLRLMPYKLERDSDRAAMFYAGMIIIINEIFEEFI